MSTMMLATASICGLVHAQIFSCKDSHGRTLTSDREIPECAARDMREIGKNGIVRRVIPAPLTAEQRRAKQLDEERAKQQADAALEARRRDQAMLARFRNEGEIDRAHQRALGDLHEKIRQSDRALALATDQLKMAEVEATRRSGKNIPPYVQQRIDDAKTSVSAETSRKRQIESDLSQLDKTFDDTRKRYRELTEVSAAK
jgi:hypothetical protein